MRQAVGFQPAIFPELTARFPSTRYQGSKAKIVDWIWKNIAHHLREYLKWRSLAGDQRAENDG